MAKGRISKPQSNKFVFKPGTAASIGKIDAEEDGRFLTDCFVDAGHLERALDLADSGSIFVGRTDAGKSAALLEIQNRQDHSIIIEPSTLSLKYISNSNVLRFFESLKIDLDLFYQMLWRHVFTIELLNYKFHVQQINDFHTLIDKVRVSVFHNAKKRDCIAYLTEYQGDFFKSTQERVRYAVEKFETQLKASLDLSKLGVPITADGAVLLSKEAKTEIEDQARKVVSGIRMDKLSTVNDIMADILFQDTQSKYYIIVDKLDEDWINDSLRFKLIRALIETIRSFRKIRAAKILIALRVDLLDRVYAETWTRGFQREKYKEYEIDVKLNRDTLYELTDKRIRYLIRHQYTTAEAGFDDLFPSIYKGSQQPMFDHLVNRTLYRPRDIIQFVNEVLAESVGKSVITAKTVDAAEVEYSKQRLAALIDEWRGEHPSIARCLELFRSRNSQFKLSDLESERLDSLCLQAVKDSDEIGEAARSVLNDGAKESEFPKALLAMLYKIGFLSVRPGRSTAVQYSHRGGFIFGPADVNEEMRFMITPMVWKALNITKGAIKGDIEQ